MNKKQLIVAWVMGILMVIAFIISPYYRIWYGGAGYVYPYNLVGSYRGPSWHFDKFMPRVALQGTFTNLIKYVSPILILGVLLIYALKDKKK